MAKRYRVTGGLDEEGYPRPSIVIEVDGDELEVTAREQAQALYTGGNSPEKVAEFLGGTVVDE